MYKLNITKNTLLLFLLVIGMGCQEYDPNLNKKGEDILEINEVTENYVREIELTHRDSIYIPIYSDIYSYNGQNKTLLTATLSIRNTSIRDSLFIEDIIYYDSKGVLVRNYINGTLLLSPLQTIEYVIDHEDVAGGTGANFIVNWGANNPQLKPIFQGIMISTKGQHGLSFVTEGISISERK